VILVLPELPDPKVIRVILALLVLTLPCRVLKGTPVLRENREFKASEESRVIPELPVHKVCKASRVYRERLALPALPVLTLQSPDRKVILDPLVLRGTPVLLGLTVLRVFKGSRVLRVTLATKVLRAFKAFKARLALLGQMVLRVFRVSKVCPVMTVLRVSKVSWDLREFKARLV
jgi:hypothetical protein